MSLGAVTGFVCVLVACVLQQSRPHVFLKVLSAALIAVSMLSVWIQSLAGPDFPADTIQRSLTQSSLPHLLGESWPSTWARRSGLQGYVNLLPLVVLVLSVAVVVPRVLLRAEARAEAQPIRSS